MTSKEIIAELQKVGLDPANINIDKFGDDHVQDLVAELGVAMNDGDADAAAFYNTLMDAVNRFDK